MLFGTVDSEEQLKGLVTSLLKKKKQDMALWHTAIETRRKRYFLEHYPAGREPGKEYVLISDEMRLVDTARSLLMREIPKIHAYSQVGTSTSEKDSDKVEAWLRGVLYMQTRRQRADPVSLYILDMLMTGAGVLQTYWDTSITPPELPIVMKNRDPLCIFPEEGATIGRWRWVIAAEEVPILSIEEEWGAALAERGKKLKEAVGKKYEEKFAQIEVIDVWSREINPGTGEQFIANMVMTKETVLKPPVMMDKYKDLPFEISFCVPTTAREWERKGLPITAAIEGMVPEKAALWNSELRRAKLSAQLPWESWGFGSKPPELPTGFGKGIHRNENQGIKFMELPGPPPDLMVMAAKIEADIDSGGLGAPVGTAPPASPSGYALAIRGEAGTLKMVEPANSVQNALVNVCQNICSLAAAYAPDQPMVVLGRLKDKDRDEVLALTGSECDGFMIDVKVSAAFPEDKSRDMAIGTQLAMAPKPILDMRTILERFFHIENVDQVKRRLQVEMAEMHPSVQQIVLAIALAESGLEKYIPLIMPQGAGGPPGQPSAPSPPASAVPVEGVATTVMPQEELGAARSQEMGLSPGGEIFPGAPMEGEPVI